MNYVKIAVMLELGLYIMLFVLVYFEVFTLLSFIESRPERLPTAKPANDSYFPNVAIIVPCWNEEKTIQKTLNSLLALDYPKDKYEIIVVDDGSTDNTYSIAKRYESKNVRVFTKSNGGKHTALNFGAQKTSAPIIGCLDADSIVDKDALKEIVKHFQNEKVAAVVPSIKVWNPKNWLQKAQQAEYFVSIFLRKTFSIIESLFITPGPFSFYRHSIIRRLGYWKSAYMTEDLEIGLRLQTHRYKIVNEPNAVVYTNTPDTFKALFKQRVRWTYGFLKNISKYKFMLFNPRYGHLGIFILPVATLTIFIGIIMFAMFLWSLASMLFFKIEKLFYIGINPQFHIHNIDTYYINPSVLFYITVFAGALVIISHLLGKKLTNDKTSTLAGITYYLTLYSVFVPLWLVESVKKAYFSKNKLTWR